MSSGLGIGTSVSALISHGVSTTIVEIDPIVHQFAQEYFKLPSNHTSVIDDAIAFVEKSALAKSDSYSYIIHDVFTGGAEPLELFTKSFITELHRLLDLQGTIAIACSHIRI